MTDVYILTGYFPDNSGAKILGVFLDPAAANDRKAACDAVHPALTTKLIAMPVGKIEPKDIYP